MESWSEILGVIGAAFVLWLLIHLSNDRQHERVDVVHELCAPHGGYMENLRDPAAPNGDKFFEVLCRDGTYIDGSFENPELASKRIHHEP